LGGESQEILPADDEFFTLKRRFSQPERIQLS
jgi:hypothetical protein